MSHFKAHSGDRRSSQSQGSGTFDNPIPRTSSQPSFTEGQSAFSSGSYCAHTRFLCPSLKRPSSWSCFTALDRDFSPLCAIWNSQRSIYRSEEGLHASPNPLLVFASAPTRFQSVMGFLPSSTLRVHCPLEASPSRESRSNKKEAAMRASLLRRLALSATQASNLCDGRAKR